MTLHPDAAKRGTPVILGIPFDANSSWLRGAAGAPPIIRVALHSISSNSWTETGVDLDAEGTYCDAGDLKFTFQEPFPAIETKVGALLDKGLRPVCLGGDHSITLPIVLLRQARSRPNHPSLRRPS
jgi:arginase family enzyme